MEVEVRVGEISCVSENPMCISGEFCFPFQTWCVIGLSLKIGVELKSFSFGYKSGLVSVTGKEPFRN